MTREEKKKKKINRSIERRKKRMEIYVNKIYGARINSDFSFNKSIPLSAFDKNGEPKPGACWYDSNSPTKWSQFCSWSGICSSPCNGDC